MAGKGGWLERASGKATEWAGSSWAFGMAFGVIIVWAVTGPIFGFSDTWQLVINTGTTIVTFLMVFLIQRSQNKDSRADSPETQRTGRGRRRGKQPAHQRRRPDRGRGEDPPRALP